MSVAPRTGGLMQMLRHPVAGLVYVVALKLFGVCQAVKLRALSCIHAQVEHTARIIVIPAQSCSVL